MSFKVVILKTKPQSLKQAEQFLRNRKWQVIATTTLRDAIAAVIQRQPDFIMVAADHPNKKVRILPKLIGQAFPVKVVGFVETSSSMAMSVLHEMGLEYNVFPPVSGPAIERTILKIKKDDERREQEKQKAIENGTYQADQNASMTVAGGGGEGSSAREMLQKLVSGSDDDLLADDNAIVGGFAVPGKDGGKASGAPGTSEGAAGFIPGDPASELKSASQGSSPSSDSGFSHTGSETEDGKDIAVAAGHQSPRIEGKATQDGIRGKAHQAVQSGPSGAEGQAGGDGGSADAEGAWVPSSSTAKPKKSPNSDEYEPGFENPYASSWETDDDGKPRANHGERRPKVLDKNETAESDPAKPYDTPAGDAPNPPDPNWADYDKIPATARKNGPVMEHGAVDLRKTKKLPEYKQDPASFPDKDSIFVKGTQAALDDSVRVINPLTEYQPIETATNVACITINSPRFSGYLVAALGRDRKIDDAFLKSVQDRLFSFLRSNGEVIKDEESMNLKLEQVDFEDWAIGQADFLRKSVHGTDEIAMAFFPSKETSAKLEQSVSEKMLKMSIDELKDDVPVDFDLYIYLPTNQKYLLYTPQGARLFGQQRGRLRQKGVTHMHMRKESAGQVKRYRAQVYLNDKISEFRKKPKIKVGR